MKNTLTATGLCLAILASTATATQVDKAYTAYFDCMVSTAIATASARKLKKVDGSAYDVALTRCMSLRKKVKDPNELHGLDANIDWTLEHLHLR